MDSSRYICMIACMDHLMEHSLSLIVIVIFAPLTGCH
jgi:hypothetical protein